MKKIFIIFCLLFFSLHSNAQNPYPFKYLDPFGGCTVTECPPPNSGFQYYSTPDNVREIICLDSNVGYVPTIYIPFFQVNVFVPNRVITDGSPAYHYWSVLQNDLTISFNYILSGANTSLFQNYTRTFPAGSTPNLLTEINPFANIGLVNYGTTTLTISNIIVNDAVYGDSRFTPYNNASYTFEIVRNLTGNNSDSITGAAFHLQNTDKLVSWNTYLPDGKYILDMQLEGANNNDFFGSYEWFNNENIVTVSSGIATITIPASYSSNLGSTKLSIKGYSQTIDVSQYDFACMCFNTVTVETCKQFYPIQEEITYNVVSSIPIGPDVSGSKSIAINPFCQGTNGVVQFISSAITNGNYNITYSLSGANNLASSVVSVNFNSGTTNFSIPASQVSNSGNTTISIISIADGSGTSVYSPSVDFSFVVNATPNANGINSLN